MPKGCICNAGYTGIIAAAPLGSAGCAVGLSLSSRLVGWTRAPAMNLVEEGFRSMSGEEGSLFISWNLVRSQLKGIQHTDVRFSPSYFLRL